MYSENILQQTITG